MSTILWLISLIASIIMPIITGQKNRRKRWPDFFPTPTYQPTEYFDQTKGFDGWPHNTGSETSGETHNSSPDYQRPAPICPGPLSIDCFETPKDLVFDEGQALKAVNAYRIASGVAPLKLNSLLTRAAKAHAEDLSRHDTISHQGSDGSDPAVRVERTSYQADMVAENVGTGQQSFAEVFQGWKDSPGHNENLLLLEAKEIGMALVINPNSSYKTFWVQVFARPFYPSY